MKYRAFVSMLISVLLLISFFCACNGNEEQTTQPPASDEQTTEQTETTEEIETVTAQLPTEAGGTLAETNLVVTDMTVYERKADGTLVTQTEMADITLTKETVSFAGKQTLALTGDYKVNEQTDYISFALTCKLNEQAGIAVGRVFNRSDGDGALEVKCLDESDIIPLKINVIF